MPLQDILVIDLTKVLAGPFCAMQLADFGAEVIKIENPLTGDDARHIGPHVNSESVYFMSVNRNKKSISLNLKTDKGKEIFKKLVEKADVVLENFRPGTMERLGLGYADLTKINPRIIYAASSGFGHSGPYKSRPAYDPIIQGMGGIMSVTGQKGGGPTRVGVSIGDLAAGLYLAQGIVMALYYREKTGYGQKVDVAMLDCQASLLENHIARYLVAGEVPKPVGNRHPSYAPFGSFKTKDGRVIIAAGNDKLWKELCEALGHPEMGQDERFASNVLRVENYYEMKEFMESVLVEKTSGEWVAVLQDAGIPCGPINTIPDLVEDPQIKAREMLVEVEHPKIGKVGMPGIPVKMSKTPGAIKKSSPLLGEDNVSLLTGLLGLSGEEVEQLKKEGVL